MIKISKEQVKKWEPCCRYTDNNFALLDLLYGDKEVLDLEEILLLEVPPEDILWLLLREEVIGEKICRLAAGMFAENVLKNYESQFPNDNRPRIAIETCFRIALEDIPESEAWSEAESAAWLAAWSAARELQLFQLLYLIAEYM